MPTSHAIKHADYACIAVIPADNILGENVLWHAEQQMIYWIDIEAALLQRYNLANQKIEKFSLPQRVGSFAFLASEANDKNNENQIIAAFAEGFAVYNFASGNLRWLDRLLHAAPGLRFNDGRVDRQGRFWAGSMVEDAQLTEQSGSLYCLQRGGKARAHLNNIAISNGLCWSPDGLTMYHADSPTHQIFQYDFCPLNGTLNNKRLFATAPDNAHPDGSIVDAQGCVWSAHWGAGKVVRYAPDGKILGEVCMPVSQPSSVAIGGPNMDWLMVTSSKLGLNPQQAAQQPEAGHLFIYQLDESLGLSEQTCLLQV
jgi:L-arabinonolactonase